MTVNGRYDRDIIPFMSNKWFWSASVHPGRDDAYFFYGGSGFIDVYSLRVECWVRCVIGGLGVGI